MKLIYKRKDIEDKILHAVDTLADPVRQTLSPKGSNVIIEKGMGQIISTNDGFTIAKSIEVEDGLENSIIEVVKSSAFKTNSEAGDGTTSTILLSQILIKEGMKLLNEGMNPKELTKKLNAFKDKYVAEIKNRAIEVKTQKDIFNIAKISANNDDEIAKNVADTIKIVGEDGMVFIEANTAENKTVLDKDLGFKIDSGIAFKELLLDSSVPKVTYTNVPVLITDKKLYYKEEALSILRVLQESGNKALVIIARDFMGDALLTFITNHTKGNFKILLIKDPKCTGDDNTSLQDLAIYLGGKVISERAGSLVNKITIKDFTKSAKVYSDPEKTLITPIKENDKLKERVKELKKELKEDKDNEILKGRISSLTNGIVTVKVGGDTPIEVNEKIFRYEDSINATRAAIKDGYLVGGGTVLLNAYNGSMIEHVLAPIIIPYIEAVIRQIAINCEKDEKELINKAREGIGYNALTDTYEDLLEAGVVEPTRVVTQAVSNSISVANILLGTAYYIINKRIDSFEESFTNLIKQNK